MQTFAGRRAICERLAGAMTGPPPQVVTISGLGGMGKSFVLHSLRPEINAAVEPCPVAWVNFQAGETQTHVAPALWSVRRELRSTGDVRTTRFDLLYAEWYRRLTGRALEHAQFLNEDLIEIIDALGHLEDAPGIGFVARTVNWLAGLGIRGVGRVQARRVAEWFRSQPEVDDTIEWPRPLIDMSFGSIELLMSRALAADVADAGATLAPDGKPGRGDRCVIVIDTYERVADVQARGRSGFIATFVEDFCVGLVQADARVAVVLSGRDPTYWGWRLDGEEWTPDPSSFWGVPPDAGDPATCVAAGYEACRVDAFAHEDMHEYLVTRRHLDPHIVEVVLRVTGGYVLAAAIAADLLEAAPGSGAELLGDLGAPDGNTEGMRKSVERRAEDLIQRLLEQLERQGRRDLEGLLRAAAVPRVFDAELLVEMMGDDGARVLAAELVGYSFVVPRYGRPAIYSVHPIVRDLLSRLDRGSERQMRLHEAARAEFERRGEQASDDDERFLSNVEALYHRAAIEGTTGLLALDDLFERVLSQYAPDRCRAILDAVADLPLEDDDSRALAALMRARLARSLSDYPTMLAEISDAERHNGERDSQLGLRILREGSTAHRLAGNHAAAYERLDRYDACETVGESRVMQGLSARNRALVHKDTDRIGEALQETARADWLLSSLGPADERDLRAMGITNIESVFVSIARLRGRLRYLTGNYVGAVEDFERVFTAASADSQAGMYAQISVGHVLRQEGQLNSAEEIAHEAEERFAADHETRGVNTALILLGEVLLVAGKDGEAAEVFERLCRQGPGINPYGPLYGNLGLGEVARLRGETDIALTHYKSVIGDTRALGSRMEIAFAHLGQSLVYRRTDADPARRHADAALAIGRECQAPWIELYAHVCAALAQTGDEQECLASARSCDTRFVRRSEDHDREGAIIANVESCLVYGQDVELRLSFL
jgi:tetratricopeptide (TPR) repeat protein